MEKIPEERVRKILIAIQKDETDALAQLVDLIGPMLLGFLIRLLGQREDAEDALQETFVSIQANSRQYAGTGSAQGWIFRIAKNQGLQALRRRRRHSLPPEPPPTLSEPGQQACQAFDLNAALNRLPTEQRLVLLMREMLDLSYAEIAHLTETNPSTIASDIHRARKTLQSLLGEPDA